MRPDPPHFSNMLRLLLIAVFGVLLFWQIGMPAPSLAVSPSQSATDPTPTPAASQVQATPLPGSPVQVGGKTIFYVRQRVGSLSPADRAALISKRINDLATNPFAPPVEITKVESSEGTDIMAGDQILLTVTDQDAAAVGLTRDIASERVVVAVRSAIEDTRQQNSPRARVLRWGLTLAFLLGLIVVFVIINRVYHSLLKRIEIAPTEGDQKGFFRNTSFYRSGEWRSAVKPLLNIFRWAIFLFILVIVLPFLLRLFPATSKLAGQFIALLVTPFAAFWSWLVDNQKNFTTLLIIVVVTYFLIRLAKVFFMELERGTIKIGSFEPEWAPFTYRIVSFLLIIGAVIVGFPYLPGSDSDAFKGITIFLGALFTLSSTAAVTNIVAGVIQTYTGAFRVGDVIQIGTVTGIVTEKRLLATRVRTFKQEEVSIPNSVVLGTNVTNYSVMARNQGVILYTTVTIGYDAPWQQVHELMISAALATPEIVPDPPPFVLQTSLNDYNISYQLNCYTRTPEQMARIYSALHANIQDKFNQCGVEIMSPAFTALRDGNTVTIPPENRDPNYQPPGFRIQPPPDGH